MTGALPVQRAGIGQSRRVGVGLVAVAAMGWGTWPFILKHAPMPAELQSAIMMIVLTLVSFPVMLRDRVPNDRASVPIPPQEGLRRFAALRSIGVRARPAHWLGVAWLGVADAANVGLFFAAYQRTTVAIAVLTHYLTPVFVALAAPLVLGERLRRRTMAAVAISFAGLVLLLEPWRVDLSRSDLVGAALGAGSAVFYASNVLVNKRLAHVFSGSELMFLHGFVAVPLLWAFVPHGALGAVTTTSIAVVIAGSLGPGALGGLLFVWGLRRIPASHASILTLLEPFVAVVAAAVFLGQRLGRIPVSGGLLILVGAVVVVTARPQRP